MKQHDEDFKKMLIGAIGVVYGDIGTSPLYALKSCFTIASLSVIENNILGIISLFIWMLILMTTIKYVYVLLKIDNQGEGGVLTLALLTSKYRLKKWKSLPIALGIFGGALLVGDGVITPAISVLGALEGLQLITVLNPKHIVLIAITILLGLFALQRRGSDLIGTYFGPIMILWFVAISVLGVMGILQNPSIFRALSPYYAINFLISNGIAGFISLGAAILVITGAEALYADLGHFGRRSIQTSWVYFVFPALALNYLGQGALLLENPAAINSPFYNLAPEIVLYPLIILATIATITASQSIISGVFSLAWQAIMLEYLPRLKVIHTSKHRGQIYIPAVNLLLCILTITAVIKFENSDNLAVAYGLSVSGVMLISSILLIYSTIYKWKWGKFKSIGLLSPFLILDSNFFITNIFKIFDGAWYTLLITAGISYIIWVWRSGKKMLSEQKLLCSSSINTFLSDYKKSYKYRIPGCAVFMSHYPGKIPNALVINLRHNKFLHEKVILLSVITKEVPRVPKAEKFFFEEVEKNIFVVTASFGFLEVPNLHEVTTWAYEGGIIKHNSSVSCFLSKEVLISNHNSIFGKIRKSLYIFLSNNAVSAHDFFRVPNQKVVELMVTYRV
ncbi:MAG: potassium transport protein Kup [Candidatus Midichloriaceae bacterium]|jgi:KUP system potassium uptake protein|nr:potassium transport protein Kup [Candidatus Midichloriaceae bacterium]